MLRTIVTAAWLMAAAALPAAFSAPARADDPVALVEDVTGTPVAVEPMDYLAAGRVVELARDTVVTLGYLRSCVRETVTGGTITVGESQSVVTGGKVVRKTVECDGGRMRLTREQAGASGVVAFRHPLTGPLPAPQTTVYGLSPAVEAVPGARIVIERLDSTEPRLEIAVTEKSLYHGKLYDFARHKRQLAAGGLYRLALGDNTVVFRVDPTAKAGRTPLIGRLVKF